MRERAVRGSRSSGEIGWRALPRRRDACAVLAVKRAADTALIACKRLCARATQGRPLRDRRLRRRPFGPSLTSNCSSASLCQAINAEICPRSNQEHRKPREPQPAGPSLSAPRDVPAIADVLIDPLAERDARWIRSQGCAAGAPPEAAAALVAVLEFESTSRKISVRRSMRPSRPSRSSSRTLHNPLLSNAQLSGGGGQRRRLARS